MRERRRHNRWAFSLVEMVVVVIILGVLAAIAEVTYGQFAGNARDTKAEQQLGSLSTLAQIWGAQNDVVGEFNVSEFQNSLGSFPDVSATPGTTAGGSGWSIVGPSQVPANSYQFSVGFDNGMSTPVSGDGGTRVAVVTRSDTGRFYAALLLAQPDSTSPRPIMQQVPEGATAADVLGGAVSSQDPLPYSTSAAAPSPSATSSAPATSAAPTSSAAPAPAPTPASSAPSSAAAPTSAAPTSAAPASSATPSTAASVTTAASATSAAPATTASATTAVPTPTATPTPTAAAPTSAAPDPSTNPVTVTPHPNTDWTVCSPSTASTPMPTTGKAQIVTHGDTGVWWSVSGDKSLISGFKICGTDNQGNLWLLGSTGPGTGSVTSWVLRTNQAHPNVYVVVVVVRTDGTEVVANNSCDVRPAGQAVGWGATC